MRIDATTPGLPGNFTVSLDGEPLPDAVAADDLEGWVDVHILGPDGRPFVIDDEVPTHREYGAVVIMYTAERMLSVEHEWRKMDGLGTLPRRVCMHCEQLTSEPSDWPKRERDGVV